MANSSYIYIEDTTPKDYDRRKEIFNYGKGNNYPQLIKRLVNKSVTAKACANLIGSFLYGKGFDNNDFYINRDRETPNSLLRKCTLEASYYKGFAVHVGYNALGEKSSFKLVPFEWVRKSKEDVSGYVTKLFVSKDWYDRKVIPKEYDIYDPSQAMNQIKKYGIDKYNGQILYVSFSYQGLYPKSWIDSVTDDCISEYNSSKYKKNLITKGFMKNTVIVTKEFDDEDSKNRFQKGMKDQLGADGVGGINHYEADLESDDLSQEVFVQEIGSDLNDTLFQYTDKNVSDKICIAYSIPPSLIKNDDNALFGNGGTAIEQMMLNVQFRTELERLETQEIFNDLFSGTTNQSLNNAYFEIEPLITKTEIEEDNELIN